MATARKTTKTETVTQEVTVYTLELSENEAAKFKNDCANHGINGANASAIFAVRMALACPEDSEVSAPLAVGDRVRVTEDCDDFTGRVGTLVRIDWSDVILPYLVEFDDGEHWWTKGIEKI